MVNFLKKVYNTLKSWIMSLGNKVQKANESKLAMSALFLIVFLGMLMATGTFAMMQTTWMLATLPVMGIYNFGALLVFLTMFVTSPVLAVPLAAAGVTGVMVPALVMSDLQALIPLIASSVGISLLFAGAVVCAVWLFHQLSNNEVVV